MADYNTILATFIFCNFSLKMKFQNPEDRSHNFARSETAHEVPECQITLRFLKILFFAILKKTSFFKKHKNAPPRGAKTRPSPRGQISSFTIVLGICFCTCWPPCDSHCPHLRRLATPQPSPEGLCGVGRP